MDINKTSNKPQFTLSKNGKTLIKWNRLTKHVVIPDGVETISNKAFDKRVGTKVKSLTIPESVKLIKDDAFTFLVNLENIDIPDRLFKYNLFAYTPLAKEFQDEQGLVIEDGVALYCDRSAKHVTIPDSVTSIRLGAFAHCESLTSVTIPSSVTSISDHAFSACTSLKSVTIPEGVTSIGDGAFRECRSLKSITIPDSVTSIGDGAFYECNHITVTTNNPIVQTILNEEGINWVSSDKGAKRIPNDQSIEVDEVIDDEDNNNDDSELVTL